MIKTITLDGLTSVTVKESSFDMARFCWIKNLSEADVFASCVNAECTENADEVRRIPAGEFGMLDTESYETLYLNGSGTVEIVTTAFLVCPFGEGKKGGGASLSGESSYTISNAVDYPLLGLSLYGKSVQDGTPTPENPVDIVSVGDSGFDIISKNDKHFNLLSVRDNGKGIITKQPVSTVVKVGKTATYNISAAGDGIKYQWQYSTNFGTESWRDFANTTAIVNISNCKTAYNGYMYRCIVTDGSGNVEISDEATLYIVSDDCEINTASIETALPLCGIPVSSGGNYTDSNGQQWICDELIYNADGTGKIIKRTNGIIFNGSENWQQGSNNSKRCFVKVTDNIKPKFISSSSPSYLICNKYISGSADDTLSYIKTCMAVAQDGAFLIYDERFEGDVEGLKADMAANNLRVVYALKTPSEIELTAADVSALMQLHTYNGMTNIYNSGNADMDVKYCTNKMLSEYVLPITTGLQKQIDELRAAILSMGGNV